MSHTLHAGRVVSSDSASPSVLAWWPGPAVLTGRLPVWMREA